jgi:hypothetical protein
MACGLSEARPNTPKDCGKCYNPLLRKLREKVDNSSATWERCCLLGSNELGHTRVNRALIRAPGNHFRGAEFDDKVLSLGLKGSELLQSLDNTKEHVNRGVHRHYVGGSRALQALQALQAHAEHASYAKIVSITCTAFFFFPLSGVCSEASLATRTLPRYVALLLALAGRAADPHRPHPLQR